MSPKDSLLQECENLRSVLNETLRYKYGADGSRDFFEECEVRLAFIQAELERTDSTDAIGLETSCANLNQLSKLISRIERSSLGEYSWPFVEELKKIAVATCLENTLTNPNTPPKVHVLSDGGLDVYAIFPERKRPFVSKKRILTIVFPRTLKHFVLFHSILGHEIGHAMWQGSKHQRELKTILSEELLTPEGEFSDAARTAAWLYSDAAPAEVKRALCVLSSQIDENSFFVRFASWDAWVEELLCDLIGILTFGPTFVAAHSRLLYTLNPSGIRFGPQHPPVGARVNLMLLAAKLLGYTARSFQDVTLDDAASKLWSEIEAASKTDRWFNIFSERQVKAALDRIGTLLATCSPACCPVPAECDLLPLFRQITDQVPPIGFEIDESGNPACRNVDFRNILYAGWIASAQVHNIKFSDINRLCEHAIMQQRAIEIFKQG